MDLITDVREISRIGYGFMASKALFAALDLDLFTRLSARPSTLDEPVEATGVHRQRMVALPTALRGLGLVGLGDDGRRVAAPAGRHGAVHGGAARISTSSGTGSSGDSGSKFDGSPSQ